MKKISVILCSILYLKIQPCLSGILIRCLILIFCVSLTIMISSILWNSLLRNWTSMGSGLHGPLHLIVWKLTTRGKMLTGYLLGRVRLNVFIVKRFYWRLNCVLNSSLKCLPTPSRRCHPRIPDHRFRGFPWHILYDSQVESLIEFRW